MFWTCGTCKLKVHRVPFPDRVTDQLLFQQKNNPAIRENFCISNNFIITFLMISEADKLI